MAEPNPYAGDPYERLGVNRDASPSEVKMAAAAAKNKYNPDRADPENKSEFRELLYRIRDAEEAILNDVEPEYDAKSRPDSVAIKLEVETDAPIEEDTIRFLATKNDDTPITDAKVTFDGATNRTNEHGQVEFETTDPGTFEVKASKSGIDPTYEPASITVTIKERTPELIIDVDETTVPPHNDVELFVDDGRGDPVEGASVTGEDIDTVTDSTGKAVIDFSSEGNFEVTVEKEEFEPDSVEFTVEKQRETVSLEYNPEPIYVGETITVSVDTIGTPDIEVRFNDELRSLEGSGEVEFEAPSVGTFSIEATAAETIDTTYDSVSTDVEVTPIPIEVSTGASTIPTGEPVTITVKEAHTENPVEDLLITTSNGKKSTTNSGSVSFEFHEPGDIILTAGGSSPDYESVTSELEVIPDEIKLSIELSRKEIDPSEEVEVIVRDSAGDRVENALVDIDGESWRTDSRGKVHIYPEREGYYEISADKETDITSYTTATEVLRVGEPELLRINLNRETITSGDSVTVTVYDDRTDTPVSGARVEFDHSMMGDLETKITDEDGQVNPSFDNGGRVTMTATKIIDGLEETSSKKVLQVNRTKKSSKPPDDGFPIERVKTFVGKRLMNVVSLFAIVIGIGAVIIQGLSALWVLGLAVFVSIISVIAYTQIMS